MSKYVLAIDQGTTGTTVLVLDAALNVCGRHNEEFPQIYPKPGWVEHEPKSILTSVSNALRGALADSGIDPGEIAGIGITNQRETAVVWDRSTHEPIHNAIVWQCRRTADVCEQLKADGHTELFQRKTGLVIDAYFAGTKAAWLLDHVEGALEAASRAELEESCRAARQRRRGRHHAGVEGR